MYVCIIPGTLPCQDTQARREESDSGPIPLHGQCHSVLFEQDSHAMVIDTLLNFSAPATSMERQNRTFSTWSCVEPELRSIRTKSLRGLTKLVAVTNRRGERLRRFGKTGKLTERRLSDFTCKMVTRCVENNVVASVCVHSSTIPVTEAPQRLDMC